MAVVGSICTSGSTNYFNFVTVNAASKDKQHLYLKSCACLKNRPAVSGDAFD